MAALVGIPLKGEGWRVHACADGAAALRENWRTAGRCRIIVFSAGDVERGAKQGC